MLKKTLLASIALATVTSQALASQSLMETYQQAVANDPNLAIAKLQAESTQQDVKSGLSNVLPQVSWSAEYGVGSKDTAGQDESLELDFDRQSFGANLNFSQRFALAAFTAYDSLKVAASAEQMKAVQAEQDLMVTVAEKYISALRAQEALDVLKAQLEAVDRQYEQTVQRHDVGLVTITDVLDAEATLDETKVSLIRAESQYDIALQDLYIITGIVPDGVMTISEDVPIDAPSEEGQQKWVDYAIDNHPDILIAKKGLEGSELALKAKKQNLLPAAGASFTVNYSDRFGSTQPIKNNNGVVEIEDAFDNADYEQNWSASFGISITADLYTGGKNSAEILKQGLSNNIVEQQLTLLQRGKAVEVANLYRTVRADAQNVDAQKQALKSRESAMQATEVGYEVGTRNIVEVLNAQLAVFSAQNSLNNARYDYLLNLLKLKQAAGQLQLADLESIEEFLIQ